MDQPGMAMRLDADRAGLSGEQVARRIADMWADLRFDRDTLARLERDGLALEGIDLGGPCPFRIEPAGSDTLSIIAYGPKAATLLHLWQRHFVPGLHVRHGNL